MSRVTRRKFLRGVGGVTLTLPFLDGLLPKGMSHKAFAATLPRYAVFIRQADGVAQAFGSEPERFWPRNLGTITQQSLSGTDSDRALSELASIANKLLLVRGVNTCFAPSGEAHASGGLMNLTATKSTTDPVTNTARASGESIDNRIARELNPKEDGQWREPLTLRSGIQNSFINDMLSYRGPGDLRSAEPHPWNAYQRMMGLVNVPPAQVELIKARRKSVNDLVRDQVKALQSKSYLSQADHDRLDLHFTSIRDLEINSTCTAFNGATIDTLKNLKDVSSAANMEKITKLQMDLIALAFSCDYVRVATLQMGSGTDSATYTINGELYPSYHQISHRNFSDGQSGEPIPDAQTKHHNIDRMFAKFFKYLVDKLASYQLPSGTLLDQTAAVWCNDLANGPPHSGTNLPYVVAGSCGGVLKNGVYINAGGISHNRFLNTIGGAVGLRNSTGDWLDNFGDASLTRGWVDGMIVNRS